MHERAYSGGLEANCRGRWAERLVMGLGAKPLNDFQNFDFDREAKCNPFSVFGKLLNNVN